MFENVCKEFERGAHQSLAALQNVSFQISPRLRIAVVGRSGSGKSTLLHLAAGIELPTSGTILFDGQNLTRLPEKARTLLRRKQIGLVFQFFYLLPHLSVLENVILPELIAGSSFGEVESRAKALLQQVGLRQRAGDHIQQLSGGEMQRVAICRALLPEPRLLLADEPTGNLDDESARLVMDLLLELCRRKGTTLVYVTHSPEMAQRADEIWTLHSGVLEQP